MNDDYRTLHFAVFIDSLGNFIVRAAISVESLNDIIFNVVTGSSYALYGRFTRTVKRDENIPKPEIITQHCAIFKSHSLNDMVTIVRDSADELSVGIADMNIAGNGDYELFAQYTKTVKCGDGLT